jgi:hypothetical protein
MGATTAGAFAGGSTFAAWAALGSSAARAGSVAGGTAAPAAAVASVAAAVGATAVGLGVTLAGAVAAGTCGVSELAGRCSSTYFGTAIPKRGSTDSASTHALPIRYGPATTPPEKTSTVHTRKSFHFQDRRLGAGADGYT